MVDDQTIRGKTTRLEGFEYVEMVYCKLTKTYVSIDLCRYGGPMNYHDRCAFFLHFNYNADGLVIEVVHAIPTAEKVIRNIVKEKSNAH